MTVQDAEIVASPSESAVPPKETVNNTDIKKPGPAQDLRNIQALLVNGIFPGQMAPQVVQSFQLLEKMALQVEAQNVAQETK